MDRMFEMYDNMEANRLNNSEEEEINYEFQKWVNEADAKINNRLDDERFIKDHVISEDNRSMFELNNLKELKLNISVDENVSDVSSTSSKGSSQIKNWDVDKNYWKLRAESVNIIEINNACNNFYEGPEWNSIMSIVELKLKEHLKKFATECVNQTCNGMEQQVEDKRSDVSTEPLSSNFNLIDFSSDSSSSASSAAAEGFLKEQARGKNENIFKEIKAEEIADDFFKQPVWHNTLSKLEIEFKEFMKTFAINEDMDRIPAEQAQENITISETAAHTAQDLLPMSTHLNVKNDKIIMLEGFLLTNVVFVRPIDPISDKLYKDILQKIDIYGNSAPNLTKIANMRSHVLVNIKGKWYRSKVIEYRNEGFARVRIIDSGWKYIRHFSQMRTVTKEIINLPKFVVQKKLRGVPLDVNMKKYINYLKDFLHKQYRIVDYKTTDNVTLVPYADGIDSHNEIKSLNVSLNKLIESVQNEKVTTLN